LITSLQNVPNLSVVNIPPVRDRVPLTGEVRPLPAQPSAVVVLGAALQPPLTYNAFGRLESQVALTATAFATTPVSTTVTTPPITPGLPFTQNIVAALNDTFNPFIPGTPDITPFVTSAPTLPTTLTSVIAESAPGLAGALNTATFALPPAIVVAPPTTAEADVAISLPAGTTTFAPPETTVTTDPGAEGPATEETATAAPLTPPTVADTAIVTPEPAALTSPASARAEAVLTALIEARASTVIAAPNVAGTPTTAPTDPLAPAAPVAVDAIFAPATATTTSITPAAPSLAGAAIPGVPEAPTVPAQVPTAFLEAGILTPDDIVRNPFYPAMAASLYLSAMTFRLQQSSAAELNNPADNVQMVGDVRAVAAVQSDRQGPADDFRNLTRTFA